MCRKIMLLMGIIWMSGICWSQEFRRGEQMLVPPQQVLPDNYTLVPLPESVISDPLANRYDIANPYTYLEIVYDSRQKVHQLIYQTNFLGKMLFLAYSNNLKHIFGRKDKPLFLFQACIRGMNRFLSPVQVTDLAVQCILDRLNYCMDP